MKKIAFVRNPKTGSSSMRRALGDGVFNHAHEPAAFYFRFEVITFAFVRNPWERAHSWWRHQNYCKTQTFKDYIMRRALTETYVHGRYDMGFPIHDQYQWLCHEDRYVDLIGRFEQMEEHFTRIVDVLGVELVEPLQHRNKSIRRDSYPYDPGLWDQEMIDHMAPLFGPFAEEFGYLPPNDCGWGRSTTLMGNEHIEPYEG
jgi:hypothetical protein